MARAAHPDLSRTAADGARRAAGSEEVARGEHGRKRRYHITDVGIEEFRRWVNEPLPRPRERDVHKLQAAYFEYADPQAARRQLGAHIDHHEQCCGEWEKLVLALEARQVPLLRHRLARRPAEEHDAIVRFKVFAYRGMIARSRTEIAWAREGLALLDELNPPLGGTGS